MFEQFIFYGVGAITWGLVFYAMFSNYDGDRKKKHREPQRRPISERRSHEKPIQD